MAFPPYLPSEIKALVPAANASWCSKLLAVPARLAITFYNIFKSAVNEDGTASEDLKSWLGISSTSAAGVPTNVAASDGSSATQVVVGWTAVAGASSYSIYRSTGSDSSLSTLVGTSTTPSFNDTSVTVDVVYNYWVKATTTAGTSDYSTPDSGYAQSAGNSQSFQSSNTFTVPALVSSINVKCWGPGGAGGNAGSSPWGLPGTPTAPGGGGGGGEYATGDVPVTPGETLTITINATGAAVLRSSTVLVSCVGGSAGGDGMVDPGAGGAGGTLGSFDGTVTGTTRNNGTNGSAGAGAAGGAGGGTTPTETGAGTGGVGESLSGDGPGAGEAGKITISW